MPQANDTATALSRYGDWWQDLSPSSLADVPQIFADDVVFSDPFNTVHGHGGMQAVLEHMFAGLHEPRFVVAEVAVSTATEARGGYLKWRFTATARRGGVAIDFEGLSEVRLADDGRVARHIDYWDSAGPVYGQVPVLGWAIRLVKRRLAVAAKPSPWPREEKVG